LIITKVVAIDDVVSAVTLVNDDVNAVESHTKLIGQDGEELLHQSHIKQVLGLIVLRKLLWRPLNLRVKLDGFTAAHKGVRN
jgi:hypothetical protein